MLRLGRLPEAWIAPPATRELRELVRYRAKLVQLRSGLKAQVHAVMAKEGVLPAVGDMFGRAGNVQLDKMGLGDVYTMRVESLRDLIEVYDREVVMLERKIHEQLREHAGYRAIQAINGVGPTIAAIIVAEIGDVTRFHSPAALCSWAGLTPKHHESDTNVRTRSDHQARITARALGGASKAPPATTAAPNSPADYQQDRRPARQRTRPTSRSPAKSSRSSTTAYATARSAACATSRVREQLGHDQTRARGSA